MDETGSAPIARSKRMRWIAGALFAVLAVAGAAAAARATDTPAFCSTCHEMRPYHTAWASGPHSDVPCVACHVDDGAARLTHKVEALGEVRTHLFGTVRFPLASPASVPDERCVRCHEQVKAGTTGFDHAEHARTGTCQSCHRDAGHRVTDKALDAAGVLDPARRALAAGLKRANATSSASADHLPVVCSRCHDLRATACSTCHRPAHTDRGACETCHRPGPAFVFTHPAKGACDTCHTPPAKHRTGACESCHAQRGVSWTFAHPSASACASCHKAPAGHRAGACESCHAQRGTSWAFSHPAKGTCATCHARPAKHRAGACESCHPRRGASWAFTHPGSSACSSCHKAPAGHRAGSCASCHPRRGVSWAFAHPRSSACSSCHRAPGGHFGATCASCHSPGKPWASATFRHPSVPGGEHTYRSFACARCHPAGYSSVNCTSCHQSSGGDDD